MKALFLCIGLLTAGLAAFAGERPDAGPIVRADVDWLVNVLPGAGGRGDEDPYSGRTLLVEGWAEDFGRDSGGWYVTIRRVSARLTSTRCYFPPGGVESLDEMYRGKSLELMGDCAGYDRALDAVVLKNCRLIVADFRPEGIPEPPR